MATARRADIFFQKSEINERKDDFWNACFAAFSASLATVNFGYALGYTAEAEFLRNLARGKDQAAAGGGGGNGKIDSCGRFDIFAVRRFSLTYFYRYGMYL